MLGLMTTVFIIMNLSLLIGGNFKDLLMANLIEVMIFKILTIKEEH